jgi:hypothetical protein
MRLIHTKSLELSEFFDENTPPWAILSHVWEAEEISFAEWNEIQAQPDSERAKFLRQKRGYAKIREFCGLCQEGIPICRHLKCVVAETCELLGTTCCVNTDQKCQCEPLIVEWCWVDTCCIDKSSSAELTEAINSMFKWYRLARVCIAYLSDVPECDVTDESSAFWNSRWFTRGWTLQELIAPDPHGVNFYSMDWTFLGSTTFTPKTMDIPSKDCPLSLETLDLEPLRQPEPNENHNEAGLNGDEIESGTTEDQIQPGPSGSQSRQESKGQTSSAISNIQTNAKLVLPPGWETRQDIKGRPYFVDHITKTTTWVHPGDSTEMSGGQTYSAISNIQTNTKSILPPGWEERKDIKGRPYFVNHITKSTTWIHPDDPTEISGGQTYSAISNIQTNTKSVLPPGWEERKDIKGRPYFVNHITKSTTWVHPHKSNQMYRQQLWLCEIISKITKIPKEVLGPSGMRRKLNSYSIAERMSWASSRKTTRGEDIAYCLLGLFDLNMPLLYGEGSRKAFFRLQEEMIRHSYDHTLFAWQNPVALGGHQTLKVGLFADHPIRFRDSSMYCKRHSTSSAPKLTRDMLVEMNSRSYFLSNNAIHMSVPVIPSEANLHKRCPAGCRLIVLNCVLKNHPHLLISMHLCRDEKDGVCYRSPGVGLPVPLTPEFVETTLASFRRQTTLASLRRQPGGTEFQELQVRASW